MVLGFLSHGHSLGGGVVTSSSVSSGGVSGGVRWRWVSSTMVLRWVSISVWVGGSVSLGDVLASNVGWSSSHSR